MMIEFAVHGMSSFISEENALCRCRTSSFAPVTPSYMAPTKLYLCPKKVPRKSPSLSAVLDLSSWTMLAQGNLALATRAVV